MMPMRAPSHILFVAQAAGADVGALWPLRRFAKRHREAVTRISATIDALCGSAQHLFRHAPPITMAKEHATTAAALRQGIERHIFVLWRLQVRRTAYSHQHYLPPPRMLRG
jgi:hypothetical protein